MKSILTFLFFICFYMTASAQIRSQEYYEQRRAELFKKELEHYGLPTSDNGKPYDYSNPNVVLALFQKLQEKWQIRRKIPHTLPEKTIPKTVEETNLQRYDSLMQPFVDIYQLAGFEYGAEVEIVPTRRLHGYRHSNNPDEEYYYLDDARGDVALLARVEYERVRATKETLDFDTMMQLISDFDLAGFTAMTSYYAMKSKFPDKIDIIESISPLHTLSFWNINPRYDRNSSPQPFDNIGLERNNMMMYQLELGFERIPEKFIQTIEQIGDFDNNPLFFLASRALMDEKYELAKDIFVKTLLYSTKDYQYHIDRSDCFSIRNVELSSLWSLDSETQKTERIIKAMKLVSWEDFKAIQRKFRISKEQALFLIPEILPGQQQDFLDKKGKKHTVKLPKDFNLE